jgi:hypothetical protein
MPVCLTANDYLAIMIAAQPQLDIQIVKFGVNYRLNWGLRAATTFALAACRLWWRGRRVAAQASGKGPGDFRRDCQTGRSRFD